MMIWLSARILGILAVAGVAFFIVVRVLALRATSLIRRWAAMHEYEIVELARCRRNRGPFLWSASRRQSVYRIAVTDAKKDYRSGHVCLGDYDYGLLGGDDIHVIWDGDPAPR